MTDLKLQLPELNENQWKLLKRVILEEIIGEDFRTQRRDNDYVDQVEQTRNYLRAEQRHQLDELLGEV